MAGFRAAFLVLIMCIGSRPTATAASNNEPSQSAAAGSYRIVDSEEDCKDGVIEYLPLGDGERMIVCGKNGLGQSNHAVEYVSKEDGAATATTPQYGVGNHIIREHEATMPPTPGPTTTVPTTQIMTTTFREPTFIPPTTRAVNDPNGQPGVPVKAPAKTPPIPTTATGTAGSYRIVDSEEDCKDGVIEYLPLGDGERMIVCGKNGLGQSNHAVEYVSKEDGAATATTPQYGVGNHIIREHEATMPPTPGPTTTVPTTQIMTTTFREPTFIPPTTRAVNDPNGQPGVPVKAPAKTPPIPTTATGTAATITPSIPPYQTAQFKQKGAPTKVIHVVATGCAKTCGWEVLFRLIVINGCFCQDTREMTEFYRHSLLRDLLIVSSKDPKVAKTAACYTRKHYCMAVYAFLGSHCAASLLPRVFAGGVKYGRKRRSTPQGYSPEQMHGVLHDSGLPSHVLDNTTLIQEVSKAAAHLHSHVFDGEPLKFPLDIFDQILNSNHSNPEASTGHCQVGRVRRTLTAVPRAAGHRSFKMSWRIGGAKFTDKEQKQLWKYIQTICCKVKPYCSALWLRQKWCNVELEILRIIRWIKV
ncbi:uncharacterized protein LOC135825007 [Sycon ciliatum]|uniref:uncharacterized protein LOC135825007 n=1 Tax=Sycon ciliatum TaxID=27933 RepID=UPI0031F6930B